jgi:hypothetical protein
MPVKVSDSVKSKQSTDDDGSRGGVSDSSSDPEEILSSSDKQNEDNSSDELERLRKDWTASAYAFYHPIPEIGYDDNNRRFHVFRCAAQGCKKTVRWYLDKKDAKSTGNLLKHARSCWGPEAVQEVRSLNAENARKSLQSGSGSITTHFEKKKDIPQYSHKPFTKSETRYVQAC